MPHSIEQGGLPSTLDDILSFHRRTPESHILITPQEAKDILVDILYQYYVDSVRETDAKIAALRTISQERSEETLSDLTDQVEKIEAARRDQTKADLERGILKGVMGVVIRPPEPKKPLI